MYRFQTNVSVDFDVRGQRMDLHWGKHYYRILALKLKCLDGFVSYKHATFHVTRC